MRHISLFSGIGGFAYAAKEMWGNEYEPVLFCEIDPYCQAVLRKHWPGVPIWKDIRKLIADTAKRRLEKQGLRQKLQPSQRIEKEIDLLTGGFPCQPFSHAGKRRSRDDNRYLWPEMLECVRIFRPRWVVAENVYGILSIESGLVFESCCSDLEEEGYEVRAFVIPACAINAPHRRDRVWIVAKSEQSGAWSKNTQADYQEWRASKGRRESIRQGDGPACPGGIKPAIGDARNPEHGRGEEVNEFQERNPHPSRGDINAPIPEGGQPREQAEQERREGFSRGSWQRDWRGVATATCIRGVDDGIPGGMDGVSEAKHRTERLKMLGNTIVPQVAAEIMRAIRESEL